MSDNELFPISPTSNSQYDLPQIELNDSLTALPRLKPEDKNKCFSTIEEVKLRVERRQRPKLLSMPTKKPNLLVKELVKRYKVEKFYKIGEKLGVGTYSDVIEAESLNYKTQVAIKISRGKTAWQMLMKEAEFMKTLDWKYFPKFIDLNIDEVTNKVYLVMEKIDGITLSSIIEEGTCTEGKEIINIILQLVTAIKILHDKGIWHRDIKPQNVMITKSGDLKLIDFGISIIIKSKQTQDDNVEKINKFNGRFFTQVSSPLYAAPELISSECYNESIDIWGIGVIFLMLLKKSDITDVINKEILKISILHEVSQQWTTILKNILEVKPELRPSADELILMLEALDI